MQVYSRHFWCSRAAVLSILILSGSLAASPTVAQQNAPWPKARPEDVASVDAIIRATYKADSDDGVHRRDMDRFRSLFIPQAQLIDVTYHNGKPAITVRTIEEFARLVASLPPGHPRYEREVARRTETYGNLVQVWSSNVYGVPGAPKPAGHGINSITLTCDGTRWWIIAAEWKNETPGQPVPQQYLRAGK
jgi:hypothetical protein